MHSFIQLLGAVLLWLGVTGAAAAQGRPNVVLVVADDLGWADTSLFTPAGVPTPRLDALADQGVRFPAAYSAAPLCGPARAALTTGRYPQRFGYEFNTGDTLTRTVGLPLTETTLAEAMQGAGYATGLVGKWHLGTAPADYPTRRGFDEFYGLLVGQTAYIDPTLPGVHVASVGDPGHDLTTRYPASEIVTGPQATVVHDLGTYLTEDLARQAADFVDRHAGHGPFFLEVAFTAPHTPMQVTDTYYDRFPQLADEHQRIHAAMISALDDAVGEVLDALDGAGISDDTLVLFLSDNGCALYTDACTCDPVRGGKGAQLEGGVRVPLVLRWPGVLDAGTRYDAVVSLMDVFPTVATAAGVATHGLDGVDLVPYALGTAPGEPHHDLYWRMGTQHAARVGELKLWSVPAGTELFDLPTDPLELDDLGPTYPRALRAMERQYQAWERQMSPPDWTMAPTGGDQCGDWVSIP